MARYVCLTLSGTRPELLSLSAHCACSHAPGLPQQAHVGGRRRRGLQPSRAARARRRARHRGRARARRGQGRRRVRLHSAVDAATAAGTPPARPPTRSRPPALLLSRPPARPPHCSRTTRPKQRAPFTWKASTVVCASTMLVCLTSTALPSAVVAPRAGARAVCTPCAGVAGGCNAPADRHQAARQVDGREEAAHRQARRLEARADAVVHPYAVT